MPKPLFILSLLITSALTAQKTFIYCGQLIDVNKSEMLKEMTVIVEGNKITDVLKGYAAAVNYHLTSYLYYSCTSFFLKRRGLLSSFFLLIYGRCPIMKR